ncbi:MAG: hypothetical protein QXF12_08210 [Candidatus Aenigmatarchaeota archaeon]
MKTYQLKELKIIYKDNNGEIGESTYFCYNDRPEISYKDKKVWVKLGPNERKIKMNLDYSFIVLLDNELIFSFIKHKEKHE